VHERVLDFVNQSPFCTACNRSLWRDYGDINTLCDGRIRFEIEYRFIPARYRGRVEGDGELRWLGHGVPASRDVAERWAAEARIAHLRADIASLRMMLAGPTDEWLLERSEIEARIESHRAELAAIEGRLKR